MQAYNNSREVNKRMITRSEIRKLFTMNIRHCMEAGVYNGSEIHPRKKIIKGQVLQNIAAKSDFETHHEINEQIGCETDADDDQLHWR